MTWLKKHIGLITLLMLPTSASFAVDDYTVKSIKEVYIDLNLSQSTLKEVFIAIENTSIYRFHYSEEDLDQQIVITNNYRHTSIADILKDISRVARLSFRQINTDISVKKIKFKHRHQPPLIIEENIISTHLQTLDERGQPLPGVNVIISGTASGGITNEYGQLAINCPRGATLNLSYIGYKPYQLTVNNGQQIQVHMTLENEELEEVVVLGSRNQNRTVLETPVPVDVISMDDLVEHIPQLEVAQILNYVAASFSSNRQTIADGTDHVDPAALRGLSVDHVLVLINGKRRHTSALVNVNGTVGRGSVGTDLNAIPVAAIKRIEVLRDGAAAQYGSDAIGGVINIVLRDSQDALSFSSTVGQTYAGDGENVQMNVNYGFHTGDRGFINISGQYQYRGSTDRAGIWQGNVYKTNWDGTTPGIYAENFTAGDFSPFEPGVKLTKEEAEAINSANHYTNHLSIAEEEQLIAAKGGREAFSMKVGQSEVANTAFIVNSVFEIDYNKEVYIFGSMNSREGTSTGFYRLPNQDRTLTTVYPDGFLPIIRTHIFDGAVTGGLRGNIQNWNVDFSNTFGTNSFKYYVDHSLNASMGTNTPLTFNAGGFNFIQNTTNLDFSKFINSALKGINLAFGAEYRMDAYKIIAGEEASYKNYGNVPLLDSLADGTPIPNESRQVNIFYNRPGGAQVFPGLRPSNALQESRSNVGVYTDVELNLTDDLFTDIAVRYEHYSDFGKTFNWKIASRWSVMPTIAIRAALSTGFRAPSLHQRYYNSTSTMFNLNQEGVNMPMEVGTFRNDSRLANLFGIPDLTNESSVNTSAGMTWQLNDRMCLAVDGYHITIYNRVVLTGSFSTASSAEIATILDQANAQSATFFVNAIDTRTKGIDIVFMSKHPLSHGQLKSSVTANFSSTHVTGVHIPESLRGAPEQFFPREEKNRFEDAIPRSKINHTMVYQYRNFNLTLSNVRFGEIWVRTDHKNNNGLYLDQKFNAKIITDLSIGYDVTPTMNMTIGANNLFNIYPDQNRPEFRSNNTFIYSRRATQFGFNGGFYFARLNFKL